MLNQGYNRGEVADMFQVHPNQVTVVLRWCVDKGYFPEEQRQEWIKQSKINGGKMSPKNDSYSFSMKNHYDNSNLLDEVPGDESGSYKGLGAQDRNLLKALRKNSEEKTAFYIQ